MDGALRGFNCCCLIVCLLLGGCSSGVRIAYNHLDTLARWELGRYVDLDPAQKAAFEAEFTTLWDWHRRTQVPAYAADLRLMAGALEQQAPTRAASEEFLARIDRHGETLWLRLEPVLARLLPLLSDAQAAQLLAKQRHDIEKEERQHADETSDQRRQRFLRRTEESLDSWIGRLNDRQKTLANRSWTEALPMLRSAGQRRHDRLTNVDRFGALLATRTAPGFAERLRQFGDEDAEENTGAPSRFDAAERQRGRELTLEIVGALDSAQRRKLRERLLALAEDCEVLVAHAASEAGTGT